MLFASTSQTPNLAQNIESAKHILDSNVHHAPLRTFASAISRQEQSILKKSHLPILNRPAWQTVRMPPKLDEENRMSLLSFLTVKNVQSAARGPTIGLRALSD